jgi:hypothetical protein
MEEISIAVPECLRDYVEAVKARMAYLEPKVTMEFDDGKSTFQAQLHGDGEQAEAFRAELMHQLYREKIYQETLPIRRKLYGDS